MTRIVISVVAAGGARVADGWEESDHPRGNSKNPGQFAKKGSGGAAKKAEPKAKEEKPKAETRKAESSKAKPEAQAKPAPANAESNSASQENESRRAAFKQKAEAAREAGTQIPSVARKLFAQYANDTPATSEARNALAMKFAWKVGVAKQVKDAQDRAKALTSTDAPVSQGGHKLENGDYTPERRALHAKIVDDLFFTDDKIISATPKNGDKPTMVILGGRGGSGKSWLTGANGPVDAKKFIVMDSDEIKRRLPEFKGWNAGQVHEESSDILDYAVERAAARGLNVVLDQTLKSASSGPKRIEQFKAAGYLLEAHYMFCSPVTATMRALARYASGLKRDGMGRLVFPEIIMSNVDNEKNFDSLIPMVGRWSIWNNMGSAPTYVSGKGVRHHG